MSERILSPLARTTRLHNLSCDKNQADEEASYLARYKSRTPFGAEPTEAKPLIAGAYAHEYCPRCEARFYIYSVDGITMESCTCGERPVPRRVGDPMYEDEPKGRGMSVASLLTIHKKSSLHYNRHSHKEIPCTRCGKLYWCDRRHIGKRKFCTPCQEVRREEAKAKQEKIPPVLVKKPCAHCQRVITTRGKRKFCSSWCAAKARQQKNHLPSVYALQKTIA